MNLPFFLLKILTKMSTRVQAHPKNTKHSVFHQGLIKLLIIEEFNKTKKTWQHFLFWVSFKKEVHELQEAKADTPVERIKTPKICRSMVVGSSSKKHEIEVFTRKTMSVKRKIVFWKRENQNMQQNLFQNIKVYLLRLKGFITGKRGGQPLWKNSLHMHLKLSLRNLRVAQLLIGDQRNLPRKLNRKHQRSMGSEDHTPVC